MKLYMDIILLGLGVWGLGFGVWGLGIGPNPQSPIPKPQTPNPNPQKMILSIYKFKKKLLYKKKK